jgi:hypothetical protein
MSRNAADWKRKAVLGIVQFTGHVFKEVDDLED